VLELYQAEGCPYCHTVRETLTDLGLSAIVHNPRTAAGDVRNAATYDDLRNRGPDQLPLLVDTDEQTTVAESAAIVEYLEEHYA